MIKVVVCLRGYVPDGIGEDAEEKYTINPVGFFDDEEAASRAVEVLRDIDRVKYQRPLHYCIGRMELNHDVHDCRFCEYFCDY